MPASDLNRILKAINQPWVAPPALEPIRTTTEVTDALGHLADQLERGGVFLMCANMGNGAAMLAAARAGGAIRLLDHAAPSTQFWLLANALPGGCKGLADALNQWLGIYDPNRSEPFRRAVVEPVVAVRAKLDALLPRDGRDVGEPWSEADRAEHRQSNALHAAAGHCRELSLNYGRGNGPMPESLDLRKLRDAYPAMLRIGSVANRILALLMGASEPLSELRLAGGKRASGGARRNAKTALGALLAERLAIRVGMAWKRGPATFRA